MPHKKTLSSAVKKIVDGLERLDGLSAAEKQQVTVRFNEALHRLFPPAERLVENPALAGQLRVEMAVVEMLASLDGLKGLSFEEQAEALAELKETLGLIAR